MRKMSAARIDAIKKNGLNVVDEQGRPYAKRQTPTEGIHEKSEAIKKEPYLKKEFDVVGERISSISNAVEALVKVTAETNKRLLEIGTGIAEKANDRENKKPKSWGCSVTRDMSGKIKTIDIEEKP